MTADFESSWIPSDGGLILLRVTERWLGLAKPLGPDVRFRAGIHLPMISSQAGRILSTTFSKTMTGHGLRRPFGLTPSARDR